MKPFYNTYIYCYCDKNTPVFTHLVQDRQRVYPSAKIFHVDKTFVSMIVEDVLKRCYEDEINEDFFVECI